MRRQGDDPGDDARSPLPLHLLKMAVGIADLDELRRVRAARIAQLGGSWVYHAQSSAPGRGGAAPAARSTG